MPWWGSIPIQAKSMCCLYYNNGSVCGQFVSGNDVVLVLSILEGPDRRISRAIISAHEQRGEWTIKVIASILWSKSYIKVKYDRCGPELNRTLINNWLYNVYGV